MEKIGYTYFLTNQNNNVLYIRVTNSLKRRIQEHSDGKGSIFTQKYNCKKLVYFEVLPSMDQAISR
jgi:putative endonuclease